jgi:hypothetical protein
MSGLNKHDELLLRDLKLQPIALCVGYVVIGVAAGAIGLMTDGAAAKWLCLGGGFLIALGAEKLVSRRIRSAALALVRERADAGDGQGRPN